MLNLSNHRVRLKENQKRFYVFKLVQTPRSGRVVAYWMSGILMVFAATLFLPWQQNIRGYGYLSALRPQDRPQDVMPVISGQIMEWFVQEGEYVNEGDSLVKLAEVKNEYFDPKIMDRLSTQLQAQKDGIIALEDKATALDQRLTALREGMDLALSQAENKVEQLGFKIGADSASYEASKLNMKTAQDQYDREKELFAKGLTSKIELEKKRIKAQETQAKENSARNKLATTRNEYINTVLDISAKRASFNDKISKALSDKNSTLAYLSENRSKQAKLETKISNTEMRQGYYIVRANQSGYVVRSMKTGIGEIAKEGKPIVSLMPENPQKAVELYVQAVDLPLLQKGTEVRLQFDGWPALVFSGWDNASIGTFGGRIAVIDYVNSYENKYRILVVPDTNEEPWPDLLRIGSGVYGWAMLQEVPVWYEVWRQLNAFPPLRDRIQKGGHDKDKSDLEKYLKKEKEKKAKDEY